MHKDVIVIGAGISGIAAGYHLKKKCSNKTFSILEARNNIGGTWDLFKYPGIRSDSDMHTLGYRFKPWISKKSIADGPSILKYLDDTVEDYDLKKNILFNHKVLNANWNSKKSYWSLIVETNGKSKEITCNFLFLCGGYFSYSKPHMPTFKDQDNFRGDIVHPQFWNNEIDYKNKRVVVIGSGATAVTLAPEIAKETEHVVMLQRSPTYVVSWPSEDKINLYLRKILPLRISYFLVRWKNILYQSYTYFIAKKFPKKLKNQLIQRIKNELGNNFNVEKHFTPSYMPWDQRICLVPDSDLFKAIKSGQLSVQTDIIDKFESNGIVLKSGKKIEADLIVTATGIELNALNDIDVSIDNNRVNPNERLTYKGMMLSGVPNFALSFGYVNASWTLRTDLTCEYVCRLIKLMDKKNVQSCTPIDDLEAYGNDKLIDFTSGYIKRGLKMMPKQGNKSPWKNYQNYIKDIFAVRFMSIDDTNLKFHNPKD